MGGREQASPQKIPALHLQATPADGKWIKRQLTPPGPAQIAESCAKIHVQVFFNSTKFWVIRQMSRVNRTIWKPETETVNVRPMGRSKGHLEQSVGKASRERVR